MSAFVYILECADGSYYLGSARGDSLDKRLSEHQSGLLGGYTSTRRPVRLVYHEHFDRITDAIAAERRIKGWSRAKKEALIRGEWSAVQWFAKRPGARAKLSATRHLILRCDPGLGPGEPRRMLQKALPCVLRGSNLRVRAPQHEDG